MGWVAWLGCGEDGIEGVEGIADRCAIAGAVSARDIANVQ